MQGGGGWRSVAAGRHLAGTHQCSWLLPDSSEEELPVRRLAGTGCGGGCSSPTAGPGGAAGWWSLLVASWGGSELDLLFLLLSSSLPSGGPEGWGSP